MTKYNVRPLVAQEIEISTGTIISATWCRYFISITLHQCYIEATWKTRPRSNLDGHKETFNSLQEYLIMLSKNGNQIIEKQKSFNNLRYQNCLTN